MQTKPALMCQHRIMLAILTSCIIIRKEMNKYYSMLSLILKEGKAQKNKKGGITYLLNQELKLKPVERRKS